MNKFLVAVFMLITVYLPAQSPVDSLEQKLQTNLSAVERIGILSELCWQYRSVDQQKSVAYGKQAVELARKINDQKELSKSLNDLSIVYMDKTLLDSAILLLNEALAIRITLEDSVGQAAIYNKLGIIYQNRLDLSKALDNALNALKIYEALNMMPHQMIIMNNIGIIHYNLRNFSKSLEIHSQLLKLREQSGDPAGMGQTLLNLGNVHIALGDTALGMNDHKKAADIFRTLGKRDELATALNNIGAFQNLRKEYADARKNLEESLSIRRSLNKQKEICSTLVLLGELNTLTGNLKVAEKNLREAIAISRELELPLERLCYQKMARLFAELNKADSVFVYYEKYELLNNKLYESNLKNEVAGLQTKYESEKKEQEIASLKQENIIHQLSNAKQRTYYASALAVAGIAGFSLFQFQKNKRFKEKTKLRLELQKHQEQAARDVIDAEMNERRRIASELHDGVGQIFSAARMNLSGINSTISFSNQNHRQVFEKTLTLIDEGCQELRSISHAMMPEALLKKGLPDALRELVNRIDQNRLTISLSISGIDSRLAQTLETNLYRIVQEAIGNTMKHAQASAMDIQLTLNAGKIDLTIEDNGKGFQLTSIENLKGIGIKNIISRVNILNGKIDIDTQPGKGTLLAITIPCSA